METTEKETGTILEIAIYKGIRKNAKLELLKELIILQHLAPFDIYDYIESEIKTINKTL
jgi:hypothetical protein